jgi:hypothetical protein
VGFTAGTAGFFTETVTLHPSSDNALPSSTPLTDLVLTLKASVNPLPAAWNGGAGNWSDGTKWTTNPASPQNGAPSGALWAVTINNGPVALDVNVEVNTLALAGSTNNWTGKLDLTTRALVLRATAGTKAGVIATLQNQILSGKHGGLWDGPGITASTIPTTANTSLALVDNGDLHLTAFRGLALDDNSLILVQAHLGDATLDGKVDAFDLNKLAANWQATAKVWSGGDFNGDGKVDAFDLNLLAANWQFGVAGGLQSSFEAALAEVTASGGFGESGGGAASVPEPATVSLLGISMALLLSRRRKGGRG